MVTPKNTSTKDSTPEEIPVCFVIGPIGQVGSVARKKADMLFNAVIKPVVEPRYRALRADKEQRPGMITDAIVQRVLESPLVIADLTDLNANVFYELGIRHAAEKSTIHMATDSTTLPFDNAGHSTIFLALDDWDSIETAKSELAAQIAKTHEAGYKPSNPVTQAVTMRAFAASTDSEELSIARLAARVEGLESKFRSPLKNTTSEQPDPIEALGQAFANVAARRKTLQDIVETIKKHRKVYFTDGQESEWIEINSNNPSLYQQVMKIVESGDISSIVSDINDQIPF